MAPPGLAPQTTRMTGCGLRYCEFPSPNSPAVIALIYGLRARRRARRRTESRDHDDGGGPAKSEGLSAPDVYLRPVPSKPPHPQFVLYPRPAYVSGWAGQCQVADECLKAKAAGIKFAFPVLRCKRACHRGTRPASPQLEHKAACFYCQPSQRPAHLALLHVFWFDLNILPRAVTRSSDASTATHAHSQFFPGQSSSAQHADLLAGQNGLRCCEVTWHIACQPVRV